MTVSRRLFLAMAPAAPLFFPDPGGAQVAPALSPQFPSHEPDVVREFVGVSHGNVARVRALLTNRPALAHATWDWGFGDWETALGAASHVGNREIASVLLAAGARPTLFSAAMLGQLDVLKGFIAAHPGVQRTRGPHGITLLAHARAGGATDVVRYLETVEGADVPYRNDALDPASRAACLGTYAFGSAPNEKFVVTETERGVLLIRREGASDRNLFHLGDRVFHPAGAEAVRIRFAPGTPAPRVSVEDGPVAVMGTRL